MRSVNNLHIHKYGLNGLGRAGPPPETSRPMDDTAVVTEIAGCTCLRLRKAARRATQIYDRHLEPSGLTITQFGLLAHLHGQDGLTIGALADMLVMDPTTLTRTVRPLIARGLVSLRPGEEDRRTRVARLTPAGRQALVEAVPFWQAAQRQVTRLLGPGITAALNGTLDESLERLAPD